MIQLTALRNQNLKTVWLSQVVSATGDQLFTIAIMWLAVEAVGSSAGLIVAGETTSALAVGLFAGICADRFERLSLMISTDILRALVVITIPIAAHLNQVAIVHLLAVAIVVGAASALFDPCLLASLPEIVSDEQELKIANGLIDVTPRLARALAPATAGLIASVLSIYHFFTFDSITFLISAFALTKVRRQMKKSSPTREKAFDLRAELGELLHHIRYQDPIIWSFASLLFCLALWSILFTVGIPLLVKQSLHLGIESYGILVAAYGAGNVASNLMVSNTKTKRPMLVLGLGRILMGAAFFLLSCAANLWLAAIAAFFAGCGGPMGDLMILSVIQAKIPPAHLGKICSLSIFFSGLGTTLGLFLSPVIFSNLPLLTAFRLAAALMTIFGIVVSLRFANQRAFNH